MAIKECRPDDLCRFGQNKCEREAALDNMNKFTQLVPYVEL